MVTKGGDIEEAEEDMDVDAATLADLLVGSTADLTVISDIKLVQDAARRNQATKNKVRQQQQ